VTEHRWTEGRRLTLELLASVEQSGGGVRAVASVYRAVTEQGLTLYVVRAYATLGVVAPSGDVLALRAEDSTHGDEKLAREAALPIAERLFAQAAETRAIWSGVRAVAQQAPARKGLAS